MGKLIQLDPYRAGRSHREYDVDAAVVPIRKKAAPTLFDLVMDRIKDVKPGAERAKAVNDIGVEYHGLNEFAEALEIYRLAYSMEPSATFAFNVGVALEDLGDVDEAIKEYRRALKHDRTHADSWYNLGRLLGKSNEIVEGMQCMQMYNKYKEEDRG